MKVNFYLDTSRQSRGNIFRNESSLQSHKDCSYIVKLKGGKKIQAYRDLSLHIATDKVSKVEIPHRDIANDHSTTSIQILNHNVMKWSQYGRLFEHVRIRMV